MSWTSRLESKARDTESRWLLLQPYGEEGTGTKPLKQEQPGSVLGMQSGDDFLKHRDQVPKKRVGVCGGTTSNQIVQVFERQAESTTMSSARNRNPDENVETILISLTRNQEIGSLRGV